GYASAPLFHVPEERMNLKMDTKVVEGVSVVHCSGRIVFGDEAAFLRTKLKEILTGSKKVVLDLSDISYIDSGGLGILVGSYSTARSAGADIKLAGLGQRVRDVLQITKLVIVFEVYDSEQKALAAFH